jgi:hypothetical protein
MSDAATPPDLMARVRDLATTLDRAGIGYAVGGALAFGLWGETRGTKDIDIALYHDRSNVQDLFELFEELGGELERDVCRWRLETSGYFEFELHGVRVDVFIADCKLYELAKPRRVRISVGDHPVFFWSAEDLILFKLLFFRDKDKVDIQSILGVRGSELDLQYIRRSLLDVLRDDERSHWFEGTVNAILG